MIRFVTNKVKFFYFVRSLKSGDRCCEGLIPCDSSFADFAFFLCELCVKENVYYLWGMYSFTKNLSTKTSL